MKLLRYVLRFSLRSFFAALLSVSLVVGWVSVHLGATQRESAAVAKLSKIVGPVEDTRSLLLVVS